MAEPKFLKNTLGNVLDHQTKLSGHHTSPLPGRQHRKHSKSGNLGGASASAGLHIFADGVDDVVSPREANDIEESLHAQDTVPKFKSFKPPRKPHPAAAMPKLNVVTDNFRTNTMLESPHKDALNDSALSTSSNVSASFSAMSSQQLRAYNSIVKNRGAQVRVEQGGMVLEPGWNDSAARKTKEEHFKVITRKLHEFLKRNSDLAMKEFSHADSAGKGFVHRAEFEYFIEKYKFGFTTAQMAMLARSVTNDEFMVDYKAFVEKYGGKNALARSMVYKSKKGRHVSAEKYQLPGVPETHKPSKDMEAHHVDKTRPFHVFLVGFLLCPVWCMGWTWINSKFPEAKKFGRLSVMFSVLAFVGAVAGGISAYILSVEDPLNPDHCPALIGVVVALKAAGPAANRVSFWNEESDDFGNQYRFKRAIFRAYETRSTNKVRGIEQVVLVDDILDLDPQQESDGSTVMFVFRLVLTDLFESQAYVQYVQEWVINGVFLQNLLNEGLPMQFIKLASIPGHETTNDEWTTPRIMHQLPTTAVPGRESWLTLHSDPFLNRQPPLETNPLNPNDPEWRRHDHVATRTCWWVMLYSVPADTCMSNATSEGICGGLQHRVLHVDVELNATVNHLQVWTRKFDPSTDGELGTAPMPIWFTDKSIALRASGSRDLTNCASASSLTSCRYRYTSTYPFGPWESWFWIGVVGVTRRAQWAPFQVHVRFSIEDGSLENAQNVFDPLVINEQIERQALIDLGNSACRQAGNAMIGMWLTAVSMLWTATHGR